MDAQEQIGLVQGDSVVSSALAVGGEMVVNAIDAAPTAAGLAWLIADLANGTRPANAMGAVGGVLPILEIGIHETRCSSGTSAGDLTAADESPSIDVVAGISDRTGYLAMSGAVSGVLLHSPLLQKKREAVAAVKPGKRGAAYDGDHDGSDPSDALDCRQHGVEDGGDGLL